MRCWVFWLFFFFLVSFIFCVIFKEVNKNTKALMSEREKRLLLQMISNYSFVPKRQQLQLLKQGSVLMKHSSWALGKKAHGSICKFPKCNWMEMDPQSNAKSKGKTGGQKIRQSVWDLIISPQKNQENEMGHSTVHASISQHAGKGKAQWLKHGDKSRTPGAI